MTQKNKVAQKELTARELAIGLRKFRTDKERKEKTPEEISAYYQAISLKMKGRKARK